MCGPLSLPSLSLSPDICDPRKRNDGLSCCHCPIRRPRPASSGVSDCARHLGGCLLARAPDPFVTMKAGACMKPDLGDLRGLVGAPYVPSSSCIKGCHGNSWKSMNFCGYNFSSPACPPWKKRDNRANQTEKYAQPSYSLNPGHKILRCYDG